MVRLNVLLLLALVICSLGVVTSQHKARKIFQALEAEQERERQLEVEFGQLQLELSTWGAAPRIEKDCSREAQDDYTGSRPRDRLNADRRHCTMMRFKGKVAHKFAESPLLQLRLPPWRSRLMGLLILGSFGVLIGRAFYLQVLNNDFLQEKGESRYRRDIEISASRGRIADRHGDVLAISTPMKSIWAVPQVGQADTGTDRPAGVSAGDGRQAVEPEAEHRQDLCLSSPADSTVGGRAGGGVEVARHWSGQGISSLLSDR
jgi:cell division protein FtsL